MPRTRALRPSWRSCGARIRLRPRRSFARCGSSYRRLLRGLLLRGWRGGGRRADPDGLDIHELDDAELAQLTAVAAALHAAEGQPWVGGNHAVDEHLAGLDVPSQSLPPLEVAGPQIGAQSELRVIRHRHG